MSMYVKLFHAWICLRNHEGNIYIYIYIDRIALDFGTVTPSLHHDAVRPM